MEPIRIRYHESTSPEVGVIRYNDPLVKQHRNQAYENKPPKRQHKIRENKSDFDYDYGPEREDFEHMRHSVPDKYWGPYNPRLYDRNRNWEDNEDDQYYDFKYDSYRKQRPEDEYRGEYEPGYLPRQNDRRQNRGGYDAQTVPPLPLKRLDKEFETRQLFPPPDRGYHSHRPGYEPDYDRYDRRPVRDSYEPGYEPPYRGGPRRQDFYRRPEVVQSEVILPRNRVRPIPIVEEPKRDLYEFRRVPQEPVIRRSYDFDRPYHLEEPRRERVRYPTYRSEVSEKYLVPIAPPEEPPEPRVALVTIPRPVKQPMEFLEVQPEKSSRLIPHMHYDELRCAHCNDKVRPNQPEVLAYPWTVQTYPPRIPISTAKASVFTPSIRTGTVQIGQNNDKNEDKISVAATAPAGKTDDKNASKDAKNKAKTAEKGKAKGKDDTTPAKPETKGKENKKDGKSNKKEEEPKAGGSKDKTKNKKPLSETGNVPKNKGLDTVHESPEETYDRDSLLGVGQRGVVDDIKPQDSISNVDAQPLRAYPRGPNNTEHRRFHQARAHAISPVSGYSYPSGRYFPRLEYMAPPRARGTPIAMYPSRHPDYIQPNRDRGSPVHVWARPVQRSRHLYGRYYDRQNGRIYDYDVNYDGDRIYSDRRLLLR